MMSRKNHDYELCFVNDKFPLNLSSIGNIDLYKSRNTINFIKIIYFYF